MAVVTDDYRRCATSATNATTAWATSICRASAAEVHLPFGGVKKSGNGQPSAAGLVDAVTHKTAFTVNHDRSITMAQGMSAKVEEA